MLLDEEDEGKFDPGFDDTPTDAQEALPKFLFEDAVTVSELHQVMTAPSLCLVVKVPSSEWAVPVSRYLRHIGASWRFELVRESPTKGKTEQEINSDKARRAVAAGGRLFGVSQNPEAYLPRPFHVAKDIEVNLGNPTGRVIAATIRAVTGEDPGEIPDSACDGLDYDSLVASIRGGSTARECLERIASVRSRRAMDNGDGTPRVEDLGGYGKDAMSWASDLTQDLAAVRRGELRFEDIPQHLRGVVLEGPAGTGKTSFVKALGKSTGMPVIGTSAAAWFTGSSGYLDGVLKEIDATFARARAMAPAILLVDEAEAIGSRAKMEGRSAEYWTTLITHILTLLDGATSSTTGLVVVGTTNFADRLDPALIRPGRLGNVIHVPRPDEDGVRGIFRHYLGADIADADIDRLGLVGYSVGATGASIRNWVETARHVARRARRPVAPEDIMAVMSPGDDRTEETLRRTAIHEAGHAVVGHGTGLGQVAYISLLMAGNSMGSTGFGAIDISTKAAVEASVMLALGGRAAEHALLGQVFLGSGGSMDSDIARATKGLAGLHMATGLGKTMRFRAPLEEAMEQLAYHPAVGAAVDADLERLYQQTYRFCQANADLIRAVADALFESRYMDGERFLEIVEAHGPVVTKIGPT